MKLENEKSLENLPIRAMHFLRDVPLAYRAMRETRSALWHQLNW